MTLSAPIAIVVCGPSGCGKSTVASLLAERLHCEFKEGDDYHSAENVNKMRNGIPLTDEDRAPWLSTLHELIRSTVLERKKSMVLSCSALRYQYRKVLLQGKDANGSPCNVFFIMLATDPSVLAKRVGSRRGHYMPSTLVESQLRTLEPLSGGRAWGNRLLGSRYRGYCR